MANSLIQDQVLLTSKEFNLSKKYWEGHLSDWYEQRSALWPNLQQHAFRHVGRYKLEKHVSEKLLAVCKNNELSVFIYALSAYSVLIHNYSNEKLIGLAVPPLIRDGAEGAQVPNSFLPVVCSIRDGSFREHLVGVGETIVSAAKNQHYPIEKIYPDIVACNMLHTAFSSKNLHISNYEFFTPLQFTLDIIENEIFFDAVSFLSPFISIDNLVHSFFSIVEKSIINIDAPVRELSLKNEMRELEQIMALSTGQRVQQPFFLFRKLSQQIKDNPNSPAIRCGNHIVSYEALDSYSRQLAGYLLNELRLPKGARIAVLLRRSEQMIIAMIAIMRSGFVYVPVDISYPDERIKFVVDDVKPSLVITIDSHFSLVQSVNLRPVTMEDCLKGNPFNFGDETDIDPVDPAYIIYTSGSAGTPKGVTINHGNLNHFFGYVYHAFLSDKPVIFPFIASNAFDISLFQAITPLLGGGVCLVIDEEHLRDLDKLVTVIKKSTFIDTVPGVFSVLCKYIEDNDLVSEFFHVERIFIGGDSIPDSLLHKLSVLFPSAVITVTYGPTEGTIFCTSIEYSREEARTARGATIGRPIDGSQIYILNGRGDLLPAGMEGEICIGGYGISPGYFNNEILSREKFIKASFNSEMLYRSGDMGRWTQDGLLEFCGRRDQQVKIRGHRIELGEIENRLHQSGMVQQAVVLANDLHQRKSLTAYFVPQSNYEKQELATYLKSNLPDYMVPAVLIELERIPLTGNGKIDKKSLLTFAVKNHQVSPYAEPTNKTEEVLVSIWKTLLGREEIGIHDNFFELGGDSIISLQLVSRARRYGYTLHPRDIFRHQTISKLTAVMQNHEASHVQIENETLIGECGLLPAQQHYLTNVSLSVSHFNQSVLLKLSKAVKIERLEEAFGILIEHHDALRVSFKREESGWQQKYSTNSCLVKTRDLTAVPLDCLPFSITTCCDDYQRSLDIEKGIIMQVALFDTPANDEYNRLFVVIHHLVIDGVSWRILLEDLDLLLSALQNGEEAALGRKTTSCRQWYNVLAEYGQSLRLTKQRAYWSEVTKTDIPLPYDYKYDAAVFEGDLGSIRVKLDNRNTKHLLHEVPRAYHTEINDLLIASLAKTLSQWSKTSRVIIGLEGHGRENISEKTNASRTIGWFTNMYPLLINVESGEDHAFLIKSVKEQIRRVPDGGIGYNVLRHINVDPDFSGKAPWEIVFNYQGQFDNVMNDSQWFSEASESPGKNIDDHHTVEHKLAINSMVYGGELIVDWSYSRKHFTASTIDFLSKKFLQNISLLIDQCLNQLKNAPVLTPFDYGLSDKVSIGALEAFLDEPENGKPRKETIDAIYRLSALQQGLLFHASYNENEAAYLEQFSCDLLDADEHILIETWKHILDRHSILRSAFYSDTFDIPVQCVHRNVTMPLSILDFRDLSSAEQVKSIAEFKKTDRQKGFDLSIPPLMRVTLIRLDDRKYRMIWTHHHLILDGWSMPVLMEEFLKGYESLSRGEILAVGPPDNYEDYIRYIERQSEFDEEIFWRSYMEGFSQGSLLPFISSREDRNKGTESYKDVSLAIDKNLSAKIIEYARQNGLTINTVMQGAWSFLLYRYTGNTDIAFGVTVSGRPDDLERVEERLGIYINTLPLRTRIDGVPVTSWLLKIQEDQVQCRQFQYSSLAKIQHYSHVSGELFDSLMTFQNYPLSKITAGKDWKLDVSNIHIDEQTTNYPLNIRIGISSEITLSFIYKELIPRTYVEQISHHFVQVLESIACPGTASVHEIELLSSDDRKFLLNAYRPATMAYPGEKSLIECFNAQTEKTPDAISVSFKEETITYRELNKRANQLAHYLKATGVNRGNCVPVFLEKGIDLIVAILGILKSGAAYVPLDPEYPSERITFMLKDVQASIAVTNNFLKNILTTGFPDLRILDLDTEGPVIETIDVKNIIPGTGPNDLAYIMYTSGSSGIPKGVMVTHRNITSLVLGADFFTPGPADSLLSTGSISFDATTFEYWSMLLHGGTLVLCDDNTLLDTSLLKHEIANREITVMWFTSSWFNQIVDADISVFEKLLTIVVGGEKLSPSHINEVRKTYPQITIINGYGPTENTTFSLTYKIGPMPVSDNIPIGKCLNNRSAYVINSRLELNPVGVVGELLVGGDGLARGYLNQPQLTSEKFIVNPFDPDTKSFLYRTGDLARYLPDGNIEYIGRADEQVKIRGHRIEPGEIEHALCQHEFIRQAVVVVDENGKSSKQLIAYVVSHDNVDPEIVLNDLRRRLPDYMIPALLIQLENLPLTPNGKVDKKALPAANTKAVSDDKDYVTPRNALERQIVDIWKEALEVEKVGVFDDFFQLGGDSIKIIGVVSKLRNELDKELKIFDVYQSSTPAKLAALMDARLEGKRHSHIPSSIIEELSAAKHSVLSILPDADNIEDVYPMSDIQNGMVYASLLMPELSVYHDQLVFSIERTIDPTLFRQALALLVEKHSALRTGLNTDIHKAGVQIIYRDISVDVKNIYLTELPASEVKEKVRLYLQEERLRPFEFGRPPLWRAALFHLYSRTIFVFQFHHSILDGWSVASFNTELNNLYEDLLKGISLHSLPLLKCSNRDFIIESLSDQLNEDNKIFWRKEMSMYKRLDIFLDEQWSEQLTVPYSKPFLDRLKGRAAEDAISLKGILLGAYLYVLGMLSYEDDLTIGLLTNTRPAIEDGDKLLGCFLNTIPLRFKIHKPGYTWIKYFIQIEEKLKELKERDRTSLIEITKAADSPVSGPNPFFDTLFNFLNFHVYQHISTSQAPARSTATNEDETSLSHNLTNTYLDCTANITNDNLLITYTLSRKLKCKKSLEQLHQYYHSVLECYLNTPHDQISNNSVISADEQQLLLYDFNNERADYPADKTLVDLLVEQSLRSPDAIAVIFDEHTLTYRELNERSNKLANFLRNKEIKDGALIPVCLERGMEMIVGILGILKAGCAYVPIDPEYPQERTSFLMQDVSASVVITTTEWVSKFSPSHILVIDMCKIWSEIDTEEDTVPVTALNSGSIAYVIYTSGSTGRPKGVMVHHGGVVNRLLWAQDNYRLSPQDTILQKTTFCFDVSVWELFWPLLVGAKLVFARPGGQRDNSYLRTAIDQYEVTVIHFVPSMLENFLVDLNKGECSGLQKVLSSGEALKPSHVKLFQEKLPQTSLHNLYGPTEASVDVTYWPVPVDGREVDLVPIGQPVANTQIYILDRHGDLMPQGAMGEIHIGGVQVAKGYLNRPDLTAEKFIPDLFCHGGKVYKTGDFGRWLPDGNIEYLGRMDDQVKIRGFRIELGEIENVLLNAPGVRQAAIIAKSESNQDTRLIAYIVHGNDFVMEEASEYLKSRLPDYMIPSFFVPLDDLPLTSNGKLDKKSLPDPDINRLQRLTYLPPKNFVEVKLKNIWEEVLKLRDISVCDNFFDLGGHSLLAMRIVSAVSKQLNTRIAIKDLFASPTIEKLAFHISRNGSSAVPFHSFITRPNELPLSFGQERLWFIDRLVGSVQYHIPMIFKLSGSLDKKALTSALTKIVSRHEALRTIIEKDKPIQRILPPDSWSLNAAINFADMNDGKDLLALITEFVTKPFRLSQDHLMRAGLVEIAGDEYVLMIVMHHLVSDGWSLTIFMNELVKLYSAYVGNHTAHLSELPMQYADFAIWQRQNANAEILEEKLQYWIAQLQNTKPLVLPTDYARPAIQTVHGATLVVDINNELFRKVKELSGRYNITTFMALLAAFKVLMYRLSGQRDICVGSAIANRPYTEVESIIGFFANTLALRTIVADNQTFESLLLQVKKITLDAYDHQEVPLEKIVEKVVKERDMSRSPLFQVMFDFQHNSNAYESSVDLMKNLTLAPVEFIQPTSKFDLTFTAVESQGKLSISIEYCTALFTESTIKRYAGYYEQLLKEIVENPCQELSKIPMLTQAQCNQLLERTKADSGYPRNKNMIDLFERWVYKKPSGVAVKFDDQTITYKELNERANQVAHFLRNNGVKEGALVPICLERSIDMIIGILGILKAGAAYVPVDPAYPPARIRFMLEDTEARLIVSRAQDCKPEWEFGFRTILLDENWEDISKCSSDTPVISITPDNLAYVIYTSGSTGRPKGVMVEHKNVVRLFETDTPIYDFNEDDVWCMFHSFCFDFSVWEIFGALFYGGKLVIVPRMVAKDTSRFAELLVKEHVTILNQTPSAFYVLQECFFNILSYTPCMRYIIFGGEALNPFKVKGWIKKYPETKLVNMYGITETTVHVTYQPIEEKHSGSTASIIGKPIPTLSVYVLDAEMQLQPVGVAGELYVGGAGVARGYLNLPQLTKERFISNPFTNESGDRLYKTGDLGRWLDDGSIEYLGRIDDQVKIRGYRIELGEIESVILQSGLVSHAVLVNKKHGDNAVLIAYVVATGVLDKVTLGDFVRSKLPNYMVPALFIEVESIPLTTNGKIDKNALPDPGLNLTNEYVAPYTNIQKTLASAWQDVLKVERVGIYDNFFELGGHSLLTMKVAAFIQNEFSVIIPIHILFELRNLYELSEYIELNLSAGVPKNSDEGFRTMTI